MTAAVVNCDNERTRLHIDWEGVSGATAGGLNHAVQVTYENSRKHLHARLHGLHRPRTGLQRGGHNAQIDEVQEKGPRNLSGKSSLAVATPPLPPKYTRLNEDFHELAGMDLIDKNMKLVQRIIIMNKVSDVASLASHLRPSSTILASTAG